MPERDDFRDLPALARFGDQLVAAARQAPSRRRSWRSAMVTCGGLVGVAVTATATAAVLHSSVIPAPDPRVLPAAQTPVDNTAVVATPRAADPAGGPPWALRLTRSQTGLTCTLVGQVRDGIFGLVGEDGVFRAVPTAVSDACSGGLLVGSRIVAADRPREVRTIVYGVTGDQTRRVTLVTTTGRRTLPLGARGTFVAALRGSPEDTGAQVEVTDAAGRRTLHSLGARPGIVPDVGGAPAWKLDRYVLGTRQYCAHLSDARYPASGPTGTDPGGGRASAPTTCIDRRASFSWAASAVRLRPGQHGRPGFDPWSYRRDSARTVVLGVARAPRTVVRVTVRGAGAPKTVEPAPNGTFALLLPASVDPAGLRFDVRLRGGRIEHGRPGHGTVPDIVPARRAR